MKVWVVMGISPELQDDNTMWVDAVFTSEEAAKKHIQEQTERFAKDQARINDLGFRMGELTMAEENELGRLVKYWHWRSVCPEYQIKAFELQE